MGSLIKERVVAVQARRARVHKTAGLDRRSTRGRSAINKVALRSSDEKPAASVTEIATNVALAALALIVVVGYLAWWQPAHPIAAHTNELVDRTGKTMRGQARKSLTRSPRFDRRSVSGIAVSSPHRDSNEASDEDEDTSQSGGGRSNIDSLTSLGGG